MPSNIAQHDGEVTYFDIGPAGSIWPIIALFTVDRLSW
jgi:hypothetical protein